MTTEFWRGRRVLLTGHTGFKGAWLSLWLQRLGASVTGVALAAQERSLFHLADVGRGMKSIIQDIRDLDATVRIFGDEQPAVVIHMAAQAVVRGGFEDPVGTYATNVMGAVHVLESVRRTPSVRAVIVVTSDKCYENREWVWGYREADPMGGFDPYSSSKGCVELITSAYRRSFFADNRVSIATGRAGNVIGGGDWAADRLVPDIMSSWLAARPARIRRPNAVRPWQHVLEPLRGYMMLAERAANGDPSLSDAWNFGPADEGTSNVAAVVDRLASIWGPGAKWKRDEKAGPHEATLLRLDTSKARCRLGWSPRLDLDTALQWTATWYRHYAAGADMRAFTEKQIADYESLL